MVLSMSFLRLKCISMFFQAFSTSVWASSRTFCCIFSFLSFIACEPTSFKIGGFLAPIGGVGGHRGIGVFLQS